MTQFKFGLRAWMPACLPTRDAPAAMRGFGFGPFASIWPRVDHFRSTPLKADMRTGVDLRCGWADMSLLR